MAEEGLMFGGLEIKAPTKFDEIEKIAESLTEEREKTLESLRKVIGV
ncbi:MAG: hypothetical protein ACP5F8_02670 [Candidatus Aenigmatarchaeota archaeon]